MSSSNCKIDFSKPLLFLAPMEGVVDPVMRELLTEQGAIDVCVTEFVRVTNHLHNKDIFFKYCPELHTQSRTTSGVPVLLQLLGSDTNAMAENAAKAVELGAFGIDLNFGCPAKTVNNHDGGAALLKTPERVYKIIEAVRASVPSHISVSAKIRLGFDSKNYVTEIAQATAQAGASWLTIHARTKMDGYKPPAYWEYIGPLTEILPIPIVANGEVWTAENHSLCVERSRTPHVMIGRGLVANPGLAREIRYRTNKQPWTHWQNFILTFIEKSKSYRHANYAVQRTKQLTKMMGQTYGEAIVLLEDIKRLEDHETLVRTVLTHFSTVSALPEMPSPRFIVPRSLAAPPVVSPPTLM